MKQDKSNLQASLQESFIRLFPQLVKHIRIYASMPVRNKEEETHYQELTILLQRSLPYLKFRNNFLIDELLSEFVDYYYSLRSAALKGEQHAMRILKELAPLLHAALLFQVYLN